MDGHALYNRQPCADELLEKLGLSSATMRNHLSHSFNPAPPILTCNPVPSNTSKAPSPCITTRTTCTTLDFSRVVAVAPGTRTPTAGLIIMICYFLHFAARYVRSRPTRALPGN